MTTSLRSWKRPTTLVILSALAIGGLALGGSALAATNSSHQGTSSAPAAQPQAVHIFARNARGLTYGSELDAADPAHAPDLIAAYATNGKLGYVLAKQLHPQGPSGPTAALRAQAVTKAAAQIPVYALDGVTRIGVFEITPATGS
jgi:hypothetical protein